MKRPDKLKMLIVEDDKLIGQMIKDFFSEEADYTFIQAETGQQAYDLCLAEKPDIIITDLILPEMDGADLITKLRKLPDFAVTPIIACTAGGPELQEKARAAGAHMVVKKPLDMDALAASVDTLIRTSPFLKQPSLIAAPAEAWSPRGIAEGIPSLKKLIGRGPGGEDGGQEP